MKFDPKNPPLARTHQEAQKFVELLWKENIDLRNALHGGRLVLLCMSAITSLALGSHLLW